MLSKLKHFTTKHIIKQFADKLGFVYFGDVTHSDEHQVVLGVTASTRHVDRYYTVGTFEKYDTTILQRSNSFSFPNKPDSQYTWLIIQVDLHKNKFLHAFIDNNHHDETFFSNMAIAFSKLQDMSPMFEDLKGARVLTSVGDISNVRLMISPAIASTLTQHFSHLDLEIKDDQLYIYASDVRLTPAMLESTLKLAVWLAGQIDNYQPIN